MAVLELGWVCWYHNTEILNPIYWEPIFNILVAAQALSGNGAKVYITGRRKEILEKTAQIHGNGQIIPLPMDVTSKESIKNAVEEVKKHEKYVNV